VTDCVGVRGYCTVKKIAEVA